MTEKITLLFLLFVISSTVILSQPKSSVEWIDYSNPLEEFTVAFPKNSSGIYSSARGISDDFKRAKDWSRTYYSHSANAFHFVFAGRDLKYIPLEKITIFAKPFNPVEKKVSIGNYSGKEVTFKDDELFFHRYILLSTKNRTYLFHAISLSRESIAASRFLNSIRINRKFGLEDQIEERELKDLVSRRKEISESKFPIKLSGGISNGNAKELSCDNSPLRILSKPQPIFTALAKDYFITGKVIVRVRFKENGEVEIISPTKKLPLGLTKSAIKAAEGIRFRPTCKDGQPVSVIKRVRFTFEIIEIAIPVESKK